MATFYKMATFYNIIKLLKDNYRTSPCALLLLFEIDNISAKERQEFRSCPGRLDDIIEKRMIDSVDLLYLNRFEDQARS